MKQAAISAAAAAAAAVSPWHVIQLLPLELRFVHLKQQHYTTTTSTSTNPRQAEKDTAATTACELEKEDQLHIQKELSKIVITVETYCQITGRRRDYGGYQS